MSSRGRRSSTKAPVSRSPRRSSSPTPSSTISRTSTAGASPGASPPVPIRIPRNKKRTARAPRRAAGKPLAGQVFGAVPRAHGYRSRPATRQLRRERPAPAMMQAVDRAFGAACALCDLCRREAGEVAQDEHLPLVGRERRECLAEVADPPGAGMFVAVVGSPNLLDGDRPLAAEVVYGDVARNPQNPREEGDLTLLVLADDMHELGKDVLGDVLGLMLVVNDTAHITEHVVGVSCVQETQGLAVAFLSSLDGSRNQPRRGDAVAVGRPLGHEWPCPALLGAHLYASRHDRRSPLAFSMPPPFPCPLRGPIPTMTMNRGGLLERQPLPCTLQTPLRSRWINVGTTLLHPVQSRQLRRIVGRPG